jgi:hypothetical protein
MKTEIYELIIFVFIIFSPIILFFLVGMFQTIEHNKVENDHKTFHPILNELIFKKYGKTILDYDYYELDNSFFCYIRTDGTDIIKIKVPGPTYDDARTFLLNTLA